jgi:hypothetical protein
LTPTQCAERDIDAGWDQPRWVKILDRIEHRQPDVGLRFWGPPLWLEVTMVGPDSDLWPSVSEQPSAWDWQSNAPCVEAVRLAHEGADDDHLLAVVARYTIENLILNAVHEIGEWFRFDGRRVFPAHRIAAAAPFGCDGQGNGAVTLQLEFGGAAPRPAAGHPNRRMSVRRLADAAAPSRFTYLPGTTVSYEAAGPMIQTWANGERTTAGQSTWSSPRLKADPDDPELVVLVAQDVHRALVSHEADRICRALHVDARRPWRLAVPESPRGADPPDTDAHGAELLSISIKYADVAATGAR